MSDTEENRSGASSALLNIASAYSDSDSSQEPNEDIKSPNSPKSLGGLVENLRAEIKKTESEVTKVSEGQVKSNSNFVGLAGDVEKSQSVTKIVRLDSGKVVKISTSPGLKASEVRQEETHSKQLPVSGIVNNFRSPDLAVSDQQTSNDSVHNSGGDSSIGKIFNNSPGPESIESDKVEPVIEKGTILENKSCEVEDVEAEVGTLNNGKECFRVNSELNNKTSANLPQDISVESENIDYCEVMGMRSSKESVKLDEEKNEELRAEESASELGEVFRDVKSSDLSDERSTSSIAKTDFPTDGDSCDKAQDISKSLDTFQESSSTQDINVTQKEELSDLGIKTDSNILNAYLNSEFENKEAEEVEAELNKEDSVESKVDEVNTNQENRFQSTELKEIEKLTTAGSVADHSVVDRKDVEIVILDQGENSCSGNDEETLKNNSDIFEVKPRPELKSIPRFERVKSRPPVSVVDTTMKKTDSELQASSPALYKMLESCEAHQPTSTSDVKKTTAPGPVKLKRNFGVISASVNEQQEKRFRSEQMESNRSDNDLLPDITILPSTPDITSQRMDCMRSPPKIQISNPQSSLSSTFQQEPYQMAFGKINTSSNQSFHPLKKSPQNVPQVSRGTRREEHKRTLPLILRKAEISSAKREAAKLEDSSSKVTPKKEEVFSSMSSMNTEGGISMGTVSSESREQSVSVPFSSSSSNQDMSNSEGLIDFENVISSSLSGKETKVPPLTGDSGSDNAMPPPTEGEETKEPTSFLSQPAPPVEVPALTVPKKRGRPRKFPLPETSVNSPGTWSAQEKNKATPKSGKRRKSGKTKADKDAIDETPKKRSVPRYKKKKKPGEGEETEITRSFNKKGRMEVMTEGCKPVTVSQITEYFWPPISSLPAGEKPEGLMIQEQISEYLGVKSFKRKYPSIKRRPVDMEERNYLQENGYVSENMCDMGLTAVNSADIIEIMYNDFPHKFEEYRKHTREKKIKEQKALREKQAAENMDPRKEALESTVSWNTEFNKTRQ